MPVVTVYFIFEIFVTEIINYIIVVSLKSSYQRSYFPFVYMKGYSKHPGYRISKRVKMQDGAVVTFHNPAYLWNCKLDPFHLQHNNTADFIGAGKISQGLQKFHGCYHSCKFTFLAQYTLKKKLISFNIPVPVKNDIVPKIPFSFYAKTFGDAGYSYNKAELDTRLGNLILYSGGFGLDMLTLYDISLRIEYSFNQLGEKGLFLHIRGGF